MIITGLTKGEFEQAVAKAGVAYSDNLRPDFGTEYSAKRFRARVLLKQTGNQLGLPTEDLAPGQKRSGNVMGGQRRVAAVCWHVYRDVLVEVFNINPNAKVRTAYAKYLGEESFYEEYPKTANINIGSLMYPVSPVECCDC